MWVYHHDDPFDRAMHQDTSATQSDAGVGALHSKCDGSGSGEDVGSKADVAAAEDLLIAVKLQEDLLIAGGLE